MCSFSIRGIMWRAALAAVGSIGLSVCMYIAAASYPDASSDDQASSLMLTIVERSVPAALDCVFRVIGSDNRPDGFFACAEWVLHATQALASDNGGERQVAGAPFDSHAR